ncbi:Estradiol 17-beta-dehydrogenase 8 [Chionoecetes opilio]|uniref:Estradiol 17-beta-dehydrogenase 8 n=1 Tax=Chionoecetes opilio TaxID=41210 RepID=A0A8J4YUR6_CHIOP|nr:Estradiol 17-beta-dehydrogenase 8 [Chionoecetes opilio]
MAPDAFNSQVALVTETRRCVPGGGSGMGRATCLQLAQAGARVVVADLSEEAARHTLSLMANPEHHLALQVDVTQQSAVERVIAAARDRYGKPPSLLVNSAGVMRTSPFLDETEARLDRVINVNLKGTFLVTQVFIKALLEGERGAVEERGAVVNIASIAAKVCPPLMASYVATKAGVIAFTKSCAAEMAK